MTKIWGTMFSHDPKTGLKRLSGDLKAQESENTEPNSIPFFSLKRTQPELTLKLSELTERLFQEELDAIQFEFLWEGDDLKSEAPIPLERSPEAAIKIAVSLAQDGVITRSDALRRVHPRELRQLLFGHFSATDLRRLQRDNETHTFEGEGSQFGCSSGLVAFNSEQVYQLKKLNKNVILVRPKLGYTDREALHFVDGILVKEGPWAAAAPYEIPTLVCPELEFRENGAILGSQLLECEQALSIDSNAGVCYSTQLEVWAGDLTADAHTLLTWADEERHLAVRANLGSPEAARQAKAFGAEGVGLCRFELLYWQENRLPLFQSLLRKLVVHSESEPEELAELEGLIAQDLETLFQALADDGKPPLVIRLLDAPIAQSMKIWQDSGDLAEDYFQGPLADWLEELSPMLGLRLGRLSLLYPSLLQMQIRSILRAWEKLKDPAEQIDLQIMMPGTCSPQELSVMKDAIKCISQEENLPFPKVGSMLENPRACLVADELAEVADFLSFGTGDLTEATCGISRYDAHLSFLPTYLEQGLLPQDPFLAIDQKSVGKLMTLAVQSVKTRQPQVELGTCGAQAVEAESLKFCAQLGLSYVSVPVAHIPSARLAAAQASLSNLTNL